MSRQRLPNRRQCESFEFRHAGLDFTLCAGSYPNGRIAEIFLSSHKPGSPIEAIAREAAVTVSIALQFGADLETIRAALTRDHDGGAAGEAPLQRAHARARLHRPCRADIRLDATRRRRLSGARRFQGWCVR
jgi:hypothetical protein